MASGYFTEILKIYEPTHQLHSFEIFLYSPLYSHSVQFRGHPNPRTTVPLYTCALATSLKYLKFTNQPTRYALFVCFYTLYSHPVQLGGHQNPRTNYPSVRMRSPGQISFSYAALSVWNTTLPNHVSDILIHFHPPDHLSKLVSSNCLADECIMRACACLLLVLILRLVLNVQGFICVCVCVFVVGNGMIFSLFFFSFLKSNQACLCVKWCRALTHVAWCRGFHSLSTTQSVTMRKLCTNSWEKSFRWEFQTRQF